MSDVAEKIEEQPDDISADLRQAVSELKIQADPQSDVVLDKPKDARARDDAGKFVEAKETPKQPVKDNTPAPVGKEVDGQPSVAAAPAPSVSAPNGFKAELKARWGEVPADFQTEILRREQALEKQLSMHDQNRDLGKKINDMAVPYLPTIRAEGSTVEKAFQDYLQTAHVLRTGNPAQKRNALLSVAQMFSVDMGVPSVQGQPAMHPALESLQGRLDRMERERQQEVQERQLQDQQNLQSEIEGFASKPGHEHFEKVRTLMGSLLENGSAQTLDEAYERAIYADPEIRATLLNAKADEDKRISEAKAKTERAKSAAVSVTGGPGGAKLNGSRGSVGSIEDDLRAAMQEVNGRV